MKGGKAKKREVVERDMQPVQAQLDRWPEYLEHFDHALGLRRRRRLREKPHAQLLTFAGAESLKPSQMSKPQILSFSVGGIFRS